MQKTAWTEKWGGRNLLVFCLAADLWKKILLWYKKSSIFCARKHLRPFLLPEYRPHSHTTIPFVSSHHSPHPFHCFPLLLICPWVYVKRLADGGKKQPQCDKCFSNLTLISKTDCRNTAFWQWRIAMVTIQPAVQKALSGGNKSQQISCPANELSL